MDVYVTASAPFSASLQYKFISSSYEQESWSTWADTNGDTNFPCELGLSLGGSPPSGYVLNFSNKFFEIGNVALAAFNNNNPSPVGDGQGIQFRWNIKGDQDADGEDLDYKTGEFNYQWSRFIVDASVDYEVLDESGEGPGGTTTNTYATNDIVKANPSSVNPTNTTGNGSTKAWQPSMTGFPNRNQVTSSQALASTAGTILGQVHLKRTGSSYDPDGKDLDYKTGKFNYQWSRFKYCSIRNIKSFCL